MRIAPLPALAALLAIGCFVTLGLWQYGRGGQKEALLQAFAAAREAPARPLAEVLAGAPALPQPVEGMVRLPAELPWLLLDNQRRGSAVGVRAYRIAQPQAHPDQPLLLEFGWLPLPPDRTLPAMPAPPTELQLSGMLLAPPSSGLRLGENPRAARRAAPVLLTYLDPIELGAQLGLTLPAVVLRPDPALPFGFARDQEALPNTLPPEKHYGYALQWFGLAGAVAVIGVLLGLRAARQ